VTSIGVIATPDAGKIRQVLSTPLGRPTTVAVLSNALLSFVVVSTPAFRFDLFVLTAALWMILGAYWLVRLIAMLFAAGPRQVVSNWGRWAIPALIVLVAAALIWVGAPLHARLALSRGAMDEMATYVIRTGSTDVPGVVGLFDVEEVNAPEWGMRFIVGACFLDRCGFAYSPDGPPPARGENSYSHIDGPWYLWDQSW
jgi:hypothetical protein